MLNTDEVEELSNAFIKLDKEANGMISKKDFKEVIGKTQPILSEDEINNIFREIDHHKNEKINYSEFLIAAINVK